MFFKLTDLIIIISLKGTICQTEASCLVLDCPDFCQYGYLKDEYGCETCQCYDPCCNYPCPHGKRCIVTQFPCTLSKCQLSCESCPPIRCGNPCPFGYTYNENGCQTCQCFDPCQNYVCGEYEDCVAEPVNCDYSGTCGVRFKCITQCPEFTCKLHCPYGYEEICGCPICSCQDPCLHTFCSGNYLCATRQVYCKNEPCFEPYCRNFCGDDEIIMYDDQPILCTDNKDCGENNTCREIPPIKMLGDFYICCGTMKHM